MEPIFEVNYKGEFGSLGSGKKCLQDEEHDGIILQDFLGNISLTVLQSL